MARFLNSQRSFSSPFELHLLLGGGGKTNRAVPASSPAVSRFPAIETKGTSETPGEYFYSETWRVGLVMCWS